MRVAMEPAPIPNNHWKKSEQEAEAARKADVSQAGTDQSKAAVRRIKSLLQSLGIEPKYQVGCGESSQVFS